jgi:hypothetical protein
MTKPGPSGPVTPVHVGRHSKLPVYNHHGSPGRKVTTFEPRVRFRKDRGHAGMIYSQSPSPSPLPKPRKNKGKARADAHQDSILSVRFYSTPKYPYFS